MFGFGEASALKKRIEALEHKVGWYECKYGYHDFEIVVDNFAKCKRCTESVKIEPQKEQDNA